MPASSVFPEFVLGHPKGEVPGTHSVPRKNPKKRPPKRPRDRIPLYGKLPHYSGPYAVGILDIEVPAEHPQTFSDITRKNIHILALETVLLTIYYPAHVDTRLDKPSPHGNRWSQPTWLPRPRDQVSRAYGRFGFMPQWPSMFFFLMTTWLTKLPAFRNALLADHWPHVDSQREHNRVEYRRGEPPPDGPENPVFPLMIFSHGLGGTRTAYSSVCGEFASYGFVVCAVEHRDGSGPRSLVNHPPDGPASREEFKRLGNIEHGPKALRKNYDVVDFIFPKDNKHDTFPSHHVDGKLRAAQIDMRLAELEEAYAVMKQICSGKGADIAARNVRYKGAIGASSHGLDGVDWASWDGRVHLDNVTMAGHSFGGATTVEVLRHVDRFQYVTHGIVYDIWGIALKPLDDPRHRIHVPVLGINSEAFMYWPDNFKIAKEVAEEANEQGVPSWLLTVRGTVHISQSDFCILYPHIASAVLKATMDPIRAIDINIDASLDFLSRVLPESLQPFRHTLGYKQFKRLLDLPLLTEMPTEHMPRKRWIAVRLRIRHEMWKRARPHAMKHYWEHLQKLGQEEVWVHVAPGKEGEHVMPIEEAQVAAIGS